MSGLENKKEESGLRTVAKAGGQLQLFERENSKIKVFIDDSPGAIGKTVLGEKRMDLGKLATIWDNDLK